jgi:hypothetical protein
VKNQYVEALVYLVILVIALVVTIVGILWLTIITNGWFLAASAIFSVLIMFYCLILAGISRS